MNPSKHQEEDLNRRDAEAQRGITIHFRFELGEVCELRELKCRAMISSISINNIGVEYRCNYWWNGERKDAWVRAEELAFLPIMEAFPSLRLCASAVKPNSDSLSGVSSKPNDTKDYDPH